MSLTSPEPRRYAQYAARLVGVVGGLALVAIAATAWSVPAGTGQPGAEVSMLSNSSGELLVSPAAKPFLRDGHLLPGQSTRGTLTVKNQTHKPLAVRVHLTAETADLLGLLRVELRAGERVLYRGPLAGLNGLTRSPLRLARYSEVELAARAWLPEGSAEGAGNRMAETTLELRSRPVEGRS